MMFGMLLRREALLTCSVVSSRSQSVRQQCMQQPFASETLLVGNV
jgi:hypothetical protein